MSAREEFERQGKLYPCPNPTHSFHFWRVIGQWRWAQDKWSTLTDSGTLQNDVVRIGTIETTDGLKGYCLVFCKFSLMFGFVTPNALADGPLGAEVASSDLLCVEVDDGTMQNVQILGAAEK